MVREQHDECLECGKPLTDYATRSLGLGPECVKKFTHRIRVIRTFDFYGNIFGLEYDHEKELHRIFDEGFDMIITSAWFINRTKPSTAMRLFRDFANDVCRGNIGGDDYSMRFPLIFVRSADPPYAIENLFELDYVDWEESFKTMADNLRKFPGIHDVVDDGVIGDLYFPHAKHQISKIWTRWGDGLVETGFGGHSSADALTSITEEEGRTVFTPNLWEDTWTQRLEAQEAGASGILGATDDPIRTALNADLNAGLYAGDDNFPCSALQWAAVDELELFWGQQAPDNEDRRMGKWEYIQKHYPFLADGFEEILQTEAGDHGAYYRLWIQQYYNWEKPNLYKVEGEITPWYAYELCKEYWKGPVRGHHELDVSMERLGSIARTSRMATLALPEGKITASLLSLLFESKMGYVTPGDEHYLW